MANTEDRVVAMSFENGKFESGVNQTLGTLGKLRESLKFSGADKGLKDLEAASNRVQLGHISNAVDGIKNKFSAMSVVGIAALASIATKAVSAGASLVKSLTIDPVIGGLKEYETNLNSVQTILANTQAAGTGLKDVNAALNELNEYSDKTIYNFSEMAKNIGTFTAAGVNLKTSTASIKGIANLAALSGSNSQQASTAMYQLSQAISAGRVGLQDWNSVVNAGMGGTVFQRALAQTAEQMGAVQKGAVQLMGPMKNVRINGKSFRESITAKPGEKSWLNSEVLVTTLNQFTGDMTDAQLAAEGFSAEQIKAIQLQAKTAVAAATEVKTLTGVFDTAKETAESGWAATWQTIFGDFEEAKKLFTGVSVAINGFIGKSADARNKVLGDWKALGGRTALIEGIKNVFIALGAILKPLKEAFRDIFPAKTGKDLYDLTVRFRDFAKELKIGPETAENLKRTFSGFFAILSIGKQVIGGIFGVFAKLLGVATAGSGGFLEFTGSIGDFLVAVDKAMKEGDGLSAIFKGLGGVLAIPVRLLGLIRDAVIGLFSGFDAKSADGLSGSLSAMGENLTPLKKLLDGVSGAWEGFLDILGRVGEVLGPAVSAIGSAFSSIGESLANSITPESIDRVLAIVKTGLLGGIFLVIKRFFSGGMNIDFGGGVLENISDTLDNLTGSLKAMQTNIQAGTLLKIAGAIALLAAALVALSLIDAEGLKRALNAMAVAFGQLLAAMAVLVKISGHTGFIQLPLIAAALVGLAVAVDLLVIAVAALSRLSWDELSRGLTGVGVLLASISAAAIPLSKNSAGLIAAGVGITTIAVAMRILASAVGAFGSMDLGSLAKGLGSVSVALTLMTTAAMRFPPGMVALGAGLVGFAVGLRLLAGAVGSFGDMAWGDLVKGLGGLAATLGIIGVALTAMPPGMAAQATSLLIFGTAIRVVASAVKSLGSMKLTGIGKGLGALAGSLGILAVGLSAMTGTLAGSAALLVASTAMLALAPALGLLGAMSWETLLKGLVTLGIALAGIGAAGILLAPVAPALLAFGIALTAIGAGIALTGAGIALISVGISALAVSGPAGIAILVASLGTLLAAIPGLVISFVEGLVKIVVAIGEAAPQFVVAMGKIIANMAQAVVLAAPELVKAFTALLQMVLTVIRDNFPDIVTTGFEMLKALLSGISDNIAEVTTMVAQIITKFLTSLAVEMPRIISAGANLLVKFLTGIANNAGRVISAGATMVVKILEGVASNIGKVVLAGANLLVKFISGLTSGLVKLVDAGATMIIKILRGIANKIPDVVKAAADMMGKFITSVAKESLRLVNTAAEALVNFLNGLAKAIREYTPELMEAGWNIAKALGQGILDGIKKIDVKGAIKGVFNAGIDGAKGLLGIHSPSTVFAEIGRNLMAGTVVGIRQGADGVSTNLWRVANGMTNTMVDTLSAIPNKLDGIMDVNPVITPVLDLSMVQRDSGRLKELMDRSGPIGSVSAKQATVINHAAYDAPGTSVTGAELWAAQQKAQPAVVFNQNNYSPKEISATEVYRQTNNQLAQVSRAMRAVV